MQAFDAIVYNLKANTDLFRIWKDIYSEHVVETNNVLVFILQNYEHIQTSSVRKREREERGRSERRKREIKY
jgi:hypothetical protein